jgi:hypothetical protein
VNSTGQLSNPFSQQTLDNVVNMNFNDFEFKKLVELADWLKVA